MQTLKLSWLGPARIELAGRTVKAETRKSAALLAYLSLLREPCSRELLATLFWPEADQQKALANLRRTLFSLNSRLPGWLDADHQTVSLRRNDKLSVDVDAFHNCLAVVRDHSHPPAEPCEQCLQALTTAAAYYRGDFLEALNLADCLDFDQWQLSQRESLRQDMGQALQRITAIQAAHGQLEEAMVTARRWLALDRLHEPASRTLMDLYARSGQKTAALRQYGELKALLADQEPELATRELLRRIQGTESAKTAAALIQEPAALPLLKTKLYIPMAPTPGVIRSALLAQLNETERHALTLLSAPAGFGKTTLLAQWIAQSSLPIAWLSLDAGDNDPYRFLSYLIAALRCIDDELGSDAQKLVQSSQLVAPHIILASLINDLSRIIGPCALVLDDCQFIVERGVHEILTYLIGHLPINFHLVIATRSDPPIPLGRLRANGQVLELRTRDLRFTDQEAARFLTDVMRLELSTEDVQVLEARTEGWVVGLKMAALSLQGHKSASEFVRAFSGSHRYVLDYLVEEVLRQQPTHVRTFLLETSFLDKLSGPLCEALMTPEWRNSGANAQEVLEYVETSNLFLIPLDDNKLWYRYHHLFADLLRSRLQHMPGERVTSLHSCASRWYEANGLPADALFHALRAGDFASAASIIEKYAPQLMAQNEFSFYLARLNEIPDDIARGRPWLGIYRAWIYARLGELEDIESLLQRAEDLIRAHAQDAAVGEMAGCIALIRANVANLRGNPEFGVEQTQKAQELLPRRSVLALDNVSFQRGFAYFASGDFSRARQEWSELARAAMITQDFDTYANAAAELADLRKIEGRLHEAHSLYHDAQGWLRQQSQCSPMFLSALEIGIAELLIQWNQLAEASSWITEGIAHAQAGGRPNTECFGCYVKACLQLASGNLDGVRATILDAESILRQHTLYPRAVAEIETIKVRLWTVQHKTSELEHWEKEHQSSDPYAGDFLHEFTNITRSRALLAQGKLDETLDLLIRLEAATDRAQRNGRLIEILILQALALQAEGCADRAVAVLSRSLHLAERGGYVRVFLDEGQPMVQLLSALRDGGVYTEQASYVGRLLMAARS